jgi:hypothetical protein
MNILIGFNKFESFLSNRSICDEQNINKIFEKVAQEVVSMREDKLFLPNGFVRDLRLYVEKKTEIIEYFNDIERKYLLLADLYGYLRIKGKI